MDVVRNENSYVLKDADKNSILFLWKNVGTEVPFLFLV
jgi:hypothetical protein